MAVTDVHGTQTAVIGTEHTLADTSAPGTYTLEVNLVNMVSGDMVELRIKKIVLTGDTVPGEVVYWRRYSGSQSADDRIVISVPVSTALSDSGAIRATLKQTLGTGRAFKWALLKYA